MALDWPNLVVGAILGFFVHWGFVELKERSVRRKLRNAYAHLAGTYVNFRVKDGGAEEPTAGTIVLTQRPDGSFEVKGLHSTGTLDWSGEVRMSLEPKNTGTGSYRYSAPATTVYGDQQLRLIPETRSLHVVTTNSSSGKRRSFIIGGLRKARFCRLQPVPGCRPGSASQRISLEPPTPPVGKIKSRSQFRVRAKCSPSQHR
jgi:hypothetical protein